ncbi:TPA: YggS family pyridoxal phosphate enzyme, partial [Candidatus Gastranaerophilales bacterium HUM_19]
REFRDELERSFNITLPELSMGMSNDYKIALREGATIIRIGRKLFK